MRKILCVIGTRPEAIKMAPVVRSLRARGFQVKILATAQHRQLLDQMLATFNLEVTWDLDVMQSDQTLGDLTGRLVPRLHQMFSQERPDAILAQGDTTTVFCAGLAAFYAGVPFGHVEAGLRSGDLNAPFPEEAMRRLTAVVSRWHFAPTEGAVAALHREGFASSSIHLVGNTVIDALMTMAARESLAWPAGLPAFEPSDRIVLVTLHRRENFGLPMQRIFETIRRFALAHPTGKFLYPVHPNPHVEGPARRILEEVPNVFLLPPLDYSELVHLLRRAYLVLTDSGGIQEEAPALGKPLLVCRTVTERPEVVSLGGALLVGTDPLEIESGLGNLWDDKALYNRMAQPRFPYGDGHAADRIVDILDQGLVTVE